MWGACLEVDDRACSLSPTMSSIASPIIEFDSVVFETETSVKPSKPWFDDGNIILQAGSAQFKVYKELLCTHSEVFRDMFSRSV
jgi:hypothetical protein